jgi:hypothetical protein
MLAVLSYRLPAACAASSVDRPVDRGSLAGYAGTYRDDRLKLELHAVAASDGSVRFAGHIVIEGRELPLTAGERDGRLEGTFESDGARFEFTASLEGETLTFTTDDTSYRLKRQAVNPLARKSAANPLTSPHQGATATKPPANVSGPGLGTARDTESRVTPGPASGTVRFKRYSVKDDAGIGGEAFSMLVPEGWRVQGGVAWRLHPAMPAYLAMKVINPNSPEILEAYPTLPFVWTEGGIPFFAPGSIYLGNEVCQPVDDPIDYTKRFLLPRFRPELRDAKVVATEYLPKVAEAVAAADQEPGVQKVFRASRVRIEYAQQSRVIEEDMYCVLSRVDIPQTRTTFWGTDRNYSFRAEKGKLDERTKVFQTMVASIKPNLEWFNRYRQLVQMLVQNQLRQIRQVGELSRYISQTSSEISELSRQAYENRQASQERINQQFSQYIRGVDEYRNPFDNRPVELPSGYREAWVNPSGEYVLSDDPNFDPNIGSTANWQRMNKTQ